MITIEELQRDPLQQLAVERCCDMTNTNRVVPITGEAGTGKTSVIHFVYHALRDHGYSVVLCAPTGKAAKRIHEATGIRAMTIHRLLEYPYPGERDSETGKALNPGLPRRHRDNPLEYDVVLCDEYAMVNREVHSNLIFAMKPGARIRMFGDVNQLKPIEKGVNAGKESPFQAAIRKFDGVHLDTIHRTAEGSGIAKNGKLILSGRMPTRQDDFTIKFTDKPVGYVLDWALARVDGAKDMDILTWQIITPMKKSWVGTYKLNIALQNALSTVEKADRLELDRHDWDRKLPVRIAPGDKVICTENMYDLRDEWDRTAEGEYVPPPDHCYIMNGEAGIVSEVDDYGVHVFVGDRTVTVPYTCVIEHPTTGRMIDVHPTRNLDLAYAITTHKAQGSEWKQVCYVLNKSTQAMQTRHNFYTGISRARERVCVVTDQRSLSNTVHHTMSAMDRANARKFNNMHGGKVTKVEYKS